MCHSASIGIARRGPPLDTRTRDAAPKVAGLYGAYTSISFQETQETLEVVLTRT